MVLLLISQWITIPVLGTSFTSHCFAFIVLENLLPYPFPSSKPLDKFVPALRFSAPGLEIFCQLWAKHNHASPSRGSVNSTAIQDAKKMLSPDSWPYSFEVLDFDKIIRHCYFGYVVVQSLFPILSHASLLLFILVCYVGSDKRIKMMLQLHRLLEPWHLLSHWINIRCVI